MNANEDIRPYASSPCMMADVAEPEEGDLQLFYLHIEESAAGFRWRVRAHEQPDAIEEGRHLFASESEARADGQSALDRACSRFGRYLLAR
jgi:hypothetical protein